MNPILRVLLLGARCECSPFHLLPLDIIKLIWQDVRDFYKQHLIRHTGTRGNLPTMKIADVSSFPEYKGIQINMMPFIIGKESSLPKEYAHYWPLIKRCPIQAEEYGKVAYLTIHESVVKPGECQRRPGIHTESPGALLTPGHVTHTNLSLGWGGGSVVRSEPHGGIYMASSVANTTAIWPYSVSHPAKVVSLGGNIDHLRDFLDAPKLCQRNELWWLTDATPHECLPNPLAAPVKRQFFRLVTSNVSVWFKDHSTPNPKVPPAAKIIEGNKFEAMAGTPSK